MKGFEKLLDTVRKSNPDLISEEDANKMLDEYQEYETQLQNDSFDSGKAAGFEEGYREGIEKQKAIAKQEMDDLIEKCDEEAVERLTAILKMVNDDHAEKLQDVFDKCTAGKVDETELEKMDEDYANKFETAINAIDEDHAKKMEEACNALREALNLKFDAEKKELADSYEEKLDEANDKIEELDNTIKEERENKISMLSESVERYLNYALQDAIPTKKLISEAKYAASQKAIEKITSILKINNILQESKDGIFADYESKLAASKEEQNKLIAENVMLKKKLEKEEAKMLLESKLAKCTPAEVSFLRSYFKDVDKPSIIEEQIEDARNAFKRLHEERRAAIVNNHSTTISSKPSAVVAEQKETKKENESSVKKIVTESKKTTNPVQAANVNPFVSAYAEMLKTK